MSLCFLTVLTSTDNKEEEFPIAEAASIAGGVVVEIVLFLLLILAYQRRKLKNENKVMPMKDNETKEDDTNPIEEKKHEAHTDPVEVLNSRKKNMRAIKTLAATDETVATLDRR